MTTKRKRGKPLTDDFCRTVKPIGTDKFGTLYSDGEGDHGAGNLCLRVTPNGARTFVFRYSVDGKRKMQAIGPAGDGKDGTWTLKMARAERDRLRSVRRDAGPDLAAVRRAAAAALEQAAREGKSFRVALEEYVTGKRRGKDGLALKVRTVADYCAMVEPATDKRAAGELFDIAATPINQITGDDIHRVFDNATARGKRRGTYAAQVLRAVLRWHGVKIADDPLSKDTAGRDRIILSATTGDPNPIPAEYLGAWWNAALSAGTQAVGGTALAGDCLRFMLLTGCRPGEVTGDSQHGLEPIKVGSFDDRVGCVTLQDTKNRKPHRVLLSKQALKIVRHHAKGKKASDPLFEVGDTRKTMVAICTAAGIAADAHTLKDLRKTFATVADELVSAYALKRMMNHTMTGDVTGAHYVKTGDATLRAGWQAVADAVEALATEKVAP